MVLSAAEEHRARNRCPLVNKVTCETQTPRSTLFPCVFSLRHRYVISLAPASFRIAGRGNRLAVCEGRKDAGAAREGVENVPRCGPQDGCRASCEPLPLPHSERALAQWNRC